MICQSQLSGFVYISQCPNRVDEKFRLTLHVGNTSRLLSEVGTSCWSSVVENGRDELPLAPGCYQVVISIANIPDEGVKSRSG